MSNIVDLLLKQAETLRSSELETTIRSTVKELMGSGMEFEKAASLVEQEVESTEDSLMVQVLEKTASYISDLETENSELRTKISERPEVDLEASELHTKLASAGFTEDEIKLLEEAPSLMTKVASNAQEPWGLGQAVGVQREKTDPLLEWILS